MPKPHLHTDPAEEAAALLRLYSGANGLAECMKVVTAQFAVIQGRSQLLLTLAALTVTVTGFSGPRIVASGPFARWALIIGLVVVMVGVAALLSNLRVRWITQFRGDDPHAVLTAIIRHRQRKTERFLKEVVLLGIGMGFYVAGVIAYLITGDPV